jgi:GNAT superfamily N-acetyltransferase
MIRRATLDDLETLLAFEQSIIEAERPYDVTIKSGDVNYYDLAELISSPRSEVLVAEAGAKIIGSGYALIKDSEPYLEHSKHAYLGFMYVVPDHRRQGVNKMIVEALAEWSLAQDVTEVRLEVYAGNLAAVRAYERSGFDPHMLEMRLDLRRSGLSSA